MGNAHFRFKQFTIEQDRCAMKVGTDGVLLGAWADIEGAQRILDVGTGTGLIALMCAQRVSKAQIHAIEIDPSAADQASENIANSPFSDQIFLQHVALQDFQPAQPFDAIICNPPFFKAGTKSPIPERRQARHTGSLTMMDLFQSATRWITDTGKLHLIIPLDREGDLGKQCKREGWFIERLTTVYPNSKKPAKRILVSCVKHEADYLRSELTIEKESRFDYTSEYIELTSAFYPRMA